MVHLDSESSFSDSQTNNPERKIIDTNENNAGEKPVENVPPSIPANPMLSALEQAIRKRQEKLLEESSSPKSIDNDGEDPATVNHSTIESFLENIFLDFLD